MKPRKPLSFTQRLAFLRLVFVGLLGESAGAEADTFGAQGRVEGASEPVDIGFTIVGRVKRVLIEEGSKVEQGQPIAELECGEERARSAEFGAIAESIRNAYQRARRGARKEEREVSAARTVAAQAEFENASADEVRIQTLVDKGNLASKQQLEHSQLRRDIATADFDVARRLNALTNSVLLPEENAKWTADQRAAEARADAAADHLKQCVLVSPETGLVLRRRVHPGTIITGPPFVPAFTVSDVSHMRIRGEVDERDASRVKIGQQVSVTLPLRPEVLMRGAVSWVSPVMGRKLTRGIDPADKTDRDVREVLIDCAPATVITLPIGLRVELTFSQ